MACFHIETNLQSVSFQIPDSIAGSHLEPGRDRLDPRVLLCTDVFIDRPTTFLLQSLVGDSLVTPPYRPIGRFVAGVETRDGCIGRKRARISLTGRAASNQGSAVLESTFRLLAACDASSGRIVL